VLTNVEADHLDFYGSFEGLVEAFGRFLARVPAGGRVIAGTDSEAVRGLLTSASHARNIETFALERAAAWTADGLQPGEDGAFAFMVTGRSEPLGQFRLRIPGRHNVANALAAIAAGDALGLPVEAMQEAVASYRGIRRRFEVVGQARGVVVMDDYAHHPTEVKATLSAARVRFGGRRLICLFQPHTYSRTRYLLDEFRTCFSRADALFVLDTYAAREKPDAGMGARELAALIDRPPAHYVASFREAVEAALRDLRPGDVFFTIGAGDVDQVGPMILEGLTGGPGAKGQGPRETERRP